MTEQEKFDQAFRIAGEYLQSRGIAAPLSEVSYIVGIIQFAAEALEKERNQVEMNDAQAQPALKVVLTSFPESNGKRNWTAFFKRVEPFDGLAGSCGGITIDYGECWNRIAYEAERARVLLGERISEPDILEYGKDVKTPEEWLGNDPEGVFGPNAKAIAQKSVPTKVDARRN